jgi:hypothetical protein
MGENMNRVRVAACLSAALLAGCSLLPGSDRTDKEKVTVGELLPVVKQAIRDAQNELGPDSGLPDLFTVTLTLQTKATMSGALSAELLIVSGSVKGEDAATQSITIKLVTPKRPPVKALVQEDERYKQIVAAIKAAAVAARQAAALDDQLLKFDSVGATVTFDVSRTISGGVKLDVAGLKLGPSASYATSGSQKIEMTFKDP